MPFLSPNRRCQNIKHHLNAGSSHVAEYAGNYYKPFNGLFSRTTWVSRYQKGKIILDFTGARDSEWQWHQLGHMQVCTMLQADNHVSTPLLSFLQAGCPSCKLNKEDAMDRCKWRKMIKEAR